MPGCCPRHWRHGDESSRFMGQKTNNKVIREMEEVLQGKTKEGKVKVMGVGKHDEVAVSNRTVKTGLTT